MKSVTKSPRTEILRIVTLRYKLIVRNWKISTTTVLQRCVYAWSLTLDLQDGGVVIKNGQNDFVHVLPQTQVYLLLLLQSIHQLRARQRESEREREREKEEKESESGRERVKCIRWAAISKRQRYTNPPATDLPHLLMHCQSQLPGTELWFDRKTGS